MSKESLKTLYGRILVRSFFVEGGVVLAIVLIGVWQDWFSDSARSGRFSDAFMIVGLFLLILAGLSLMNRGDPLAGQGVNPAMAVFTKIKPVGTRDLDQSDAIPGQDRTTAMLQANATTLSLALAGIIALVVGIVL
jgi:hypothetical protein